MSRARRLKEAVKASKTTADKIIISFEKEAKKRGTILPTSPVTISRHLNGKRAFSVEEAEAYARVLKIDPAEILFEPLFKTISGSFDPDQKWLIQWKNLWNEQNTTKVRIPREFWPDRYRLLEVDNVTSTRHGQIFVYERNTEKNYKIGNKTEKEFLHKKNFESLCLIGLEDATQNPNENNEKKPFGSWVIGCVTPRTKDSFSIHDIESKLLYDKVKITKLDPIVMVLNTSIWNTFHEDKY